MLVNVLFDGLLQFPSAAEHPAAQLLLCQRREPALHLVQPRAAGGGEVQVIARPPGQPALDGGGLVGGVVVQDKVHVEVRGYGRIDPVEEAPELVDRCRRWQAPMTSPVFTSRAAKREVVP